MIQASHKYGGEILLPENVCIGFEDMCVCCVLSHETFVLLILGVRDQVQPLLMLSHTSRHQDSVLCVVTAEQS